jgi:iron complex transport system substrate-binding protein
MGKLFVDAGANYFYANDTTAGSLPLNVETVLKNFSETDIWLSCNFKTINELLKSSYRKSCGVSLEVVPSNH